MRHCQSSLFASLIVCFLSLTLVVNTACTSGRQQQLEAAIKTINESYPMPIDEGITIQCITLEDSDVAMVFNLKEELLAEPLTQENVEEWRGAFISTFGTMVHDNSAIDQLFRLIHDTDHTLSVKLTTVPSFKTSVITFSKNDLESVLSVNKLPTK